MKKISLISLHTPTKENVRGASALPYHFIANKPKDVLIEVYTFNINKLSEEEIRNVEKELGVYVNILPINIYCNILRMKSFIWLRMFKRMPILQALSISKSIKRKILADSDYVWIYGEDIGQLASLFSRRMKCVVTTPDCEALYYDRVLSLPKNIKGFNSIIRYSIAYYQYINLARELPIDNVSYHLVGSMDDKFLRMLNPKIIANFLPHPHYDGNTKRSICFHSPKLKLLISGRYDFYCKYGVDEAVQAISESSDLRDKYVITFQGRGWDTCVEKLRLNGFDVVSIGYVDSYKDELCCHDVLLSSIILGTGTKGKVLDAFINGLLVVGTARSIENICVKDQTDFFLYEDTSKLIEILRYIPNNVAECVQIAQNGRNAVLTHHNIQVLANKFYNLFN